MTVKCIKKPTALYTERNVTKGKTYIVVDEAETDYKLIDNTGKQYWYDKEFFEPPKEERSKE